MKNNKSLKILNFVFTLLGAITVIFGCWFIIIITEDARGFVIPTSSRNELMEIGIIGTISQYSTCVFAAIALLFAIIRMSQKKSILALYILNIILVLATTIAYILFFNFVVMEYSSYYQDKLWVFILPSIGFFLLILNFLFTVLSGMQKKSEQKVEINATNEEEIEQTTEQTTINPNNVQPQRLNTINIADRVQKMRQDLIDGNFDNYDETEEEILVQNPEEIQVTKTTIIPEEQIAINNSEQIYQPKVFKSLTEEFGSIKQKDPYKEVILPRRMSGIKYEGEPIKKFSEVKQRVERNVRLDGSYRDKLFVGEGERIWEVFKKTKRPNPEEFSNNFKGKEVVVNNVNSSDNVSDIRNSKPSNTMNINVNDVKDPLNDSPSPTIDWDE